MPEETSVADANRLYWESALAVSAIADRLDLSRRALYDAIRPLPAGTCPRCRGALEYPNRMARDGGTATCDRCGDEVDTDRLAPGPEGVSGVAGEPPRAAAAGEAPRADAPPHRRTAAAAHRRAASREVPAPLLDERSARILAAAAAGVLTAALGALLLRRLR